MIVVMAIPVVFALLLYMFPIYDCNRCNPDHRVLVNTFDGPRYIKCKTCDGRGNYIRFRWTSNISQ